MTRELLKDIFSVLLLSPVYLTTSGIDIQITERISVKFANGMSSHMSIHLDLEQLNLSRVDREAFQQVLDENYRTLKEKAVTDIHDDIDTKLYHIPSHTLLDINKYT